MILSIIRFSISFFFDAFCHFAYYAQALFCDILAVGDVGMAKYKTVTLTKEEMQRCIDFSNRSAQSQQAIEFGQSTTAERKVKEIARDNLIGKMAEVAVAKMLLQDFGIDIPLDFGVYDRGIWDDNDIVINGWNIDIKSTRIGHWLLIEWSKLNFRQKQGELPHTFFMCKTAWDMEKDEPLGDVLLVGSISCGRLKKGYPNVLSLKKGEYIPHTKTKLQADNFAVEFDNLNHDWNTVINYMLHNPPPDLSNYPNPYTGETFPQYKNASSKDANNNSISSTKPTDTIIKRIIALFKRNSK